MCYQVGDEYRKNTMSLVPGGSIVMVTYQTGECKIYDKVKRPFNYIKAIDLKTVSGIEVDGKPFYFK